MAHASSRRSFIKVGIASGLTGALACRAQAQEADERADLILTNAHITTLNPKRPAAAAIAIRDGRFIAVGDEQEVIKHRGDATKVIDLLSAHPVVCPPNSCPMDRDYSVFGSP